MVDSLRYEMGRDLNGALSDMGEVEIHYAAGRGSDSDELRYGGSHARSGRNAEVD